MVNLVFTSFLFVCVAHEMHVVTIQLQNFFFPDNNNLDNRSDLSNGIFGGKSLKNTGNSCGLLLRALILMTFVFGLLGMNVKAGNYDFQ